MKTESTEEKPQLDLENPIANVLRYGVVVSSVIIGIGVLLSPLKIGGYTGFPSSLGELYTSNYGRPISIGGLIGGLSGLNPLSIIEAGILVLLGVPFFRVAAGAVMYALERDWRYVAISGLVLAVLLLSTFVVAPFEAGG